MQRGNFGWAFVATVALAIGASAPTRGDDRKPQIPDLKVEKYTLPNGLEVILHEDHTTPVVGVNLWYKVGSKDEKEGRTGFAHLFEHLMFQGSKHHDSEYFGPIEKVGRPDQRQHQHRPHQLLRERAQQRARAGPLARVRPDGLPPAGPDPGEARQPARRGQERAPAAGRQRPLRPGDGDAAPRRSTRQDHPYHHSVIGSMADLSAASLEDVSAFFRTYYSPNNASLCIAGDFKPDEAKTARREVLRPAPQGPRGGEAPAAGPRPSPRPSTSR